LALLVVGAKQERDMPRYPRFHYMMDRHFLDHTKAEQVRRDSAAIKAMSDDQAISQAKMFGPLNDPIWFEVRKVGKNGEQVIYNSKG
jgi:hypothetical protein